jgi:hypothetical protein
MSGFNGLDTRRRRGPGGGGGRYPTDSWSLAVGYRTVGSSGARSHCPAGHVGALALVVVEGRRRKEGSAYLLGRTHACPRRGVVVCFGKKIRGRGKGIRQRDMSCNGGEMDAEPDILL